MRRMRRYARRPANGPSRVWSDVSSTFLFAAAAATTQVIQISLESPTNLANLGADPPEDLTILRMVGDFNVTLSASGKWRLALLVQDRTWTANTSGVDDNDKRILWSRVFNNLSGFSASWQEPGWLLLGASPPLVAGQVDMTHIDISPKVKVENGKALYLVAYEEVNGATLTVTSVNMRVLYQRSGRR